MNILVLSDIHGRYDSINKIIEAARSDGIKLDVIVVSGDITHFGGLKEAIRILRSLEILAAEKILFIPGNCDNPDLNSFGDEGPLSNIHKRVFRFRDYWFMGLGGSSPTPFNTLFELSDDEIGTALASMERKVGSGSEVISVTHDPPNGTNLDLNRRGVHVGSRVIMDFILRFKPLLHISGHIHEGRGQDRVGGTVLVNPGSASLGYYAIIKASAGIVMVDLKKTGY